MKGLLFLNGTPPLKTEIEKAVAENKDSKIYCTDGAYTYLSNVCLPNTVVGDFDSVAREEINCKCEIITFNADKDFTDGFLAIKIMAERGFTDIDIYGAYGGRPDMVQSNYDILSFALKRNIKARFVGEMNTYLVKGHLKKTVKKGATVSVVPFTDSVHILYTKGLKYALSDYNMFKFDSVCSPGYIMGVSNVSADENIEISVDKGIATVFIQEGR